MCDIKIVIFSVILKCVIYLRDIKMCDILRDILLDILY